MRGLGSTLLVALLAAGCTEATLPGDRGRDGPVPVAAPSPAQMEASAARHAPCGLAPAEDGAVVRLRDDPSVSLRLPPGFMMEDSASAGPFQTWAAADTTVVVISVSSGGSFGSSADAEAQVDEGECAQRIAGRLATVGRSRVVLANGRDTLYTATVTVPHRADRWIGAAVFSPSMAGRERAVSALTTLRVDEP